MKHPQFKISNLAVENRTTVYIFTILLIIFGIMQYNSTPKEKFPEIVFPYFMIGTLHPGTSPADVENLITRPLEKHIKGIEGVKHINSQSIQDYSSIFIEFELSTNDVQAYLDVKQAVDDARSELPADLFQEPQISRIDLSEIPILFINLSGDIGLVQLKKYADELQEKIEALEEISKADIAGALDREIQINVDLYKMQAAGISFNTIQSAVAAENLTISGGRIDEGGMRRNLRLVGEFDTADQIADIQLQNGLAVRDIAEVVDGYKERESYARLNSQDVVTLNVVKKSGKNLIYAVDKIKDIVSEFRKTSPNNLNIILTGDTSNQTRNNVSDLFNTIIVGFIVVVFVLMFFMGETNALFVGIAIPMSIIVAFIFVPVVGYTMNMVVLMSFILVLGIVVDNSIVVVENIYRHYMNTPNLPIIPATKRGAGEVALAVFTGTLTTMAPFFPLIFMPGIAGKFMSFLPVTIIITLSASMLVAYVINPVFAVSFMKYIPPEEKPNPWKIPRKKLLIAGGIAFLAVIFYISGNMLPANILMLGVLLYFLLKTVLQFLIEKFQNRFLPRMMGTYKKSLAFFLRGRRPFGVLAGIIILMSFSFILLGLRRPQVVFFPKGDPNSLYVYITMPEGTHIDVTNDICRRVEDIVFDVLGDENPNVESVVSNVAVNAGSGLFERFPQDKLAKVTVTFVEYKFRTGDKPTQSYLEELRSAVSGIPGAEIRIDSDVMGPSSGMPINIEISGDDIEKLINITERLQKFINNIGVEGIEELKSSMEVNKPEIILKVDRDKANRLGLSTAQIGIMLRTAVYGSEISEFKEGEEGYPIQLRLAEEYRDNLDALLNLKLTAPPRGDRSPSRIPISSVADITYRTSYGSITRVDNKRTITLSSNVLTGYNANQIIQTINRALPKFELEPGYTVQFTGEQDTQAEVGEYLVKALFIALALIFIILVFQFNSLGKPLIIITQIFFSFTGVFLGFALFGMDVSVIMTGMGIIAVAGIVVKNGIIIVDYTDKRFPGSKNKLDAVIDAGATRLYPVLLTALSTILGLLPLAIGLNFNFQTFFTRLDPQMYWGGDNAAFWNPLAWTIIFGLAFATVLTLIVVPAMYTIFYVKKSK
ncbi:MAG: efflux RND transporter permease subunit [Candidatus Aminicenantes bacterium]|nr:efflux RND transporter permease subunit [Candidatus Aminicenantes bacterium]